MKKLDYNEKANLNNIVVILRSRHWNVATETKIIDMIIVLFKTNSYILFYFILFYFILFYFILFYFIGYLCSEFVI
jgi:hypothetical protein